MHNILLSTCRYIASEALTHLKQIKIFFFNYCIPIRLSSTIHWPINLQHKVEMDPKLHIQLPSIWWEYQWYLSKISVHSCHPPWTTCDSLNKGVCQSTRLCANLFQKALLLFSVICLCRTPDVTANCMCVNLPCQFKTYNIPFSHLWCYTFLFRNLIKEIEIYGLNCIKSWRLLYRLSY